MNKEQFLEKMEQQLLRLPKADRDDILSDFEAHFELGRENGQTEEEVSEHLGDPAELAATYLENLPENAKGEQYIPVYDADSPDAEPETIPVNPVPENTFRTPVYGDPSAAQTADTVVPAVGTASHDKGGMIALVVVLSLFVALPILGTIVSLWFGLMGTMVGVAAAGIASMVGGFAAVTANVLLVIGLCLLGVALFILSGLMLVGLIAAVKGIVMLVKWYVGICKKLIEGGTL